MLENVKPEELRYLSWSFVDELRDGFWKVGGNRRPEGLHCVTWAIINSQFCDSREAGWFYSPLPHLTAASSPVHSMPEHPLTNKKISLKLKSKQNKLCVCECVCVCDWLVLFFYREENRYCFPTVICTSWETYSLHFTRESFVFNLSVFWTVYPWMLKGTERKKFKRPEIIYTKRREGQ